MSLVTPQKRLQLRKWRTGLKISGTGERLRLCVRKSEKNIYAQVIDDLSGKTVAMASSLDLKKEIKSGANVSAAQAVGKLVAERAKAKGVEKVVFDRGGWIYHGRIKAVAEAARQAGLKF